MRMTRNPNFLILSLYKNNIIENFVGISSGYKGGGAARKCGRQVKHFGPSLGKFG